MLNQKVLLISQVFYPDEVAVANLFTNLCSVLVNQDGLDIDVWCAQPSYTIRERQPKKKIYNGINIYYLISTNFPKDKKLGRLINFITFSSSVFFRLIFSGKEEIVISHTTPPFLAIIIGCICSLKKRRFIYVMLDILPDGLLRLKMVSKHNPFVIIWKRWHLRTLKRCYKIVVIGRDMMDWVKNIFPEGSEKIHFIPLWQDDELIKPIEFKDNPFVERNNLRDNFIVQYSGNMGLWNEMRTLGLAVNRNPVNVKFVFIGGGIRQQELLKSFDEQNPSNVLLFPFCSNAEYAYSVSACHAALVSFRKGLEGIAVPSKIIGIMAASIPVIALVPDQSEIAYIVKEEKCGYVVEPGDVDGVIKAIEELKSDNNLRQSMGKRGRAAFERKYTTRIISEKYKALIMGQ